MAIEKYTAALLLALTTASANAQQKSDAAIDAEKFLEGVPQHVGERHPRPTQQP